MLNGAFRYSAIRSSPPAFNSKGNRNIPLSVGTDKENRQWLETWVICVKKAVSWEWVNTQEMQIWFGDSCAFQTLTRIVESENDLGWNYMMYMFLPTYLLIGRDTSH